MPCVSNAFTPVAEVPDDCEKISKEWLSAALNAEVTSFSTRICSEGQVAITVVLHDIVYAAAGRDDRPKSVAIKMHPATAEMRVFGTQAGLFSKELFWYTGFKDCFPEVDCPKTFGVWSGPGRPGRDKIEFFALMMEDLTEKYVPYSVEQSPSAQNVEDIALKAMVPFHSKCWDKIDLEATPELDPGGSLLAEFFPMIDAFSEVWPRVKKEWAQHIPAGGVDVGPLDPSSGYPVSWAAGLALLDRLAQPGATGQFYKASNDVWASRVTTCVHGDFNTGNLWCERGITLLCPSARPTPPLELQWQSRGKSYRGSGSGQFCQLRLLTEFTGARKPTPLSI